MRSAPGLWIGLLLLSVCPAFALNCSRATALVDKTVCGHAELVRLDDRLNHLYGDLMPQLTARAQDELRAGQRTWVTKRDQRCASGDASCLGKLYGERIDQLSALDAESRVTDTKLDSLVPPFTVVATWKAIAVRDPLAEKPASVADTRASLAKADLPDVGELVSSSPGRVCVEGQDCRFVAWKRTLLAKLPWAEAIERVLQLSPTSCVLVGDTGVKEVPGLLLLPQHGGVVWAIFSLRKTSIQDGNYAVEVWSPAAGHVGDPMQP